MSRMRAVEDGRWVVHAAVSGLSGVIDPSGRVITQSELFQPDILRATIRSSNARTWYVRLGDWLPRLALLMTAMLLVAPRRRRAGSPAPAPLVRNVRTNRESNDGAAPAAQTPARQPVPTGQAGVAAGRKVGRNDPCWCGSGKKYKRCHGA